MTFEFKSMNDWESVWEALNDAAVPMDSARYKCITVFDEAQGLMVKSILDDKKIKYIVRG